MFLKSRQNAELVHFILKQRKILTEQGIVIENLKSILLLSLIFPKGFLLKWFQNQEPIKPEYSSFILIKKKNNLLGIL